MAASGFDRAAAEIGCGTGTLALVVSIRRIIGWLEARTALNQKAASRFGNFAMCFNHVLQ